MGLGFMVVGAESERLGYLRVVLTNVRPLSRVFRQSGLGRRIALVQTLSRQALLQIQFSGGPGKPLPLLLARRAVWKSSPASLSFLWWKRNIREVGKIQFAKRSARTAITSEGGIFRSAMSTSR